jgi:hypothetical protein
VFLRLLSVASRGTTHDERDMNNSDVLVCKKQSVGVRVLGELPNGDVLLSLRPTYGMGTAFVTK